MYPYTGIGRGARHQQDAETVRQRRSHIVQRLTSSTDFSDIGSTGGVFPFAETHSRGERSTRSVVCTSLPLRRLRPCFGQEAVLADSGWACEKSELFEHPARACFFIVPQQLFRSLPGRFKGSQNVVLQPYSLC